MSGVDPTVCHICKNGVGDTPTTLSYGPILLGTICQNCTKAGLDVAVVLRDGFTKLAARARLARSADVAHTPSPEEPK